MLTSFLMFALLLKVELICDSSQAQPGDTVTVGLRFPYAEGWHTYWSNPGESGFPTQVTWQPEWKGELQYPVPEVFTIGGITCYGYEKEYILRRPWKVTKAGLKADIEYLACTADQCVQQREKVSLKLPLGPRKDSPWAAQLHAPLPQRTTVKVQRQGDKLAVELPGPGEARFFPKPALQINDSAPQPREGDRLLLTPTGQHARLQGLLVVAGKGYLIDAPIENGGTP